MRRKQLQYRFHLSTLEVTRSDGLSARIPWTELRGGRQYLIPSDAVRSLHPWLPRGIHLPEYAGSWRIRRLRVRAAARALQDGSYDRFWKRPRFAAPEWFVCIVAAAGFLFVSLMMLARARQDLLSAGAADAGQLGLILLPPLVIVLGFLAVAGAFLLFVWKSRCPGPRALAAQTTAAGIRRILDTGQETFQSWSDATQLEKRRWCRTPSLSIQPKVSLIPENYHDWRVLEGALQRIHCPSATGHEEHARDLRRHCLTWLVIGAAFALVPILRAACSPEVPLRSSTSDRTLSTVEELLVVAAIEVLWIGMLPLLMATEYGARRGLIRPLRKFFRNRFGRRTRTAA
ncbi:MAG: hypothetical protein PVJ57_11680 [Phycisphaerae bacterium]|jgi:hypothetical protein